MSHDGPKSTPRDDSEPGTAAPGPIVVDIDVHRIRRHLLLVIPDFETWCVDTNFDVGGEKLRSRITTFLAHYARINGNDEITFLNVPAFAATLNDLMFVGGTNEFLEMTHVFGAYLEFIHATGRWTGTHEEYEQVHHYFQCVRLPEFEPDYSPVTELQAAIITVPKITEQNAFEEIQKLPATRQIISFLQWFGPKREITSRRILNKKHVKEAAASLGIDALPLTGATPVGGPPKTGPVLFKSASNIGVLSFYWDALVAAGLIELSTTRAYPTREALEFLKDPNAKLVEVVRIVASKMYRAFSVEIDDNYDAMETGYLTRYFLLEAAVEPISIEVLRHPVRGLDDDDPRSDRNTIERAWRRLERLRDEGLVTIGSRLSIPPVLLRPLVLELAGGSEVAYRFADPAEEASDPPGRPNT
ncbi:hypothetical protein [Paeniglutamicibacter gangotriensis]|uniref:Uncharacterized protein n=3 Tax=Bacillati TaxID=1783272 RepID=M7MLU4_9MICC|nr:hypothetical protein [Paeniglutamicibacter gangotriensis]EMQ97277.1 hypothetical protein ADIAG_03444 [Paeniglutamicibacter gangotriensis Lz1y]